VHISRIITSYWKVYYNTADTSVVNEDVHTESASLFHYTAV